MYELQMTNYIRPFFSLLLTDPTTPHVYSSNVILGNEYLCIPSPCYHEILRRIAPFQSVRKCMSCIWTVPLAHGWSPGCTYGYLWELMGTYGNLWELCAEQLRAWERMGTYGNFVRSNSVRAWELMGTYGNVWDLMGTYGNLWELCAEQIRACVGTYGNLWELKGTYGNLWELMGTSCGATPCVRGNLWELMGTYGNLWELMGTYGNLWELRAEQLRACVGTYGNLWELMGTYGNLWELMGTYGNLWELNAWELNAWELNAWELMGTYGNWHIQNDSIFLNDKKELIIGGEVIPNSNICTKIIEALTSCSNPGPSIQPTRTEPKSTKLKTHVPRNETSESLKPKKSQNRSGKN